jgi:holliday junction DNA helicase RuvB
MARTFVTIQFSSSSEPRKKAEKNSVPEYQPSEKALAENGDRIDQAQAGKQASGIQGLPVPSALLKNGETDYDQRVESSIRPKRLSEYIGQTALKESLSIGLDAAKHRGEALDHLLLYGPPGLGKTTLAMVIAHEMEAPIHITSAPALERPRDILGLLMGMQPGSVLFIDEIHRLNKVAEEILYPAMEDFTLDRTIGKGESTRILRVPLPRFTLIGATTKAGSLSGPLRDRFGLLYRLNFYAPEELADIVLRSAGLLSIEASPEGALTIARRSRGTPRIANRLLRRVRDFMVVKRSEQSLIDHSLAHEALNLFDVDHLGLDPMDRQMLNTIIQSFGGGPVGVETLASAIGEDSRTLEDVYEPYLMQAGLINRTSRGRMVTAAAYRHLGLSLPHGWGEQAQLPL